MSGGGIPRRVDPSKLTPDRELCKIARIAMKKGWSVTKTGGSHLKWVPPSGKGFVFSPSTPSDSRSNKNTIAQLRRAGLEI